MTGKADGKEIAAMSFEEALQALEGVVAALEGGEVPLEQSIDLYERGEALRKHCEKRLKDAEMRVEKIVRGADGEPAAEPLDGDRRPAAAGDDDIPF